MGVALQSERGGLGRVMRGARKMKQSSSVLIVVFVGSRYAKMVSIRRTLGFEAPEDDSTDDDLSKAHALGRLRFSVTHTERQHQKEWVR